MSVKKLKISNQGIYLDYNASTPIFKEVQEEMNYFSTNWFYNPSPRYAQKIAHVMLDLRQDVMSMINGPSTNGGKLVFYNGGTEAVTSLLQGIALYALENKVNKRHLISTKIEHEAGMITLQHLEKIGFKVSFLSVDDNGVISLDELNSLVSDDTLFISVMHVNNETGAIQPIKEVVKIAKKFNIPVHSDGIAAVGKIDIDVEDLGVDAYSISANKFFGPRAASYNYINDNIKIRPVLFGTPKEYGLRAGTENITGMIGLHKALEILQKDFHDFVKEESNMLLCLEKMLLNIPDVKINSSSDVRVCNTLSASFAGIKAGDLVDKLSENGLCISSIGDGHSHVISSMGVRGKFLEGSVRLSLSARFNKMTDITEAANIIEHTVKSIRNKKNVINYI